METVGLILNDLNSRHCYFYGNQQQPTSSIKSQTYLKKGYPSLVEIFEDRHAKLKTSFNY